MPSQNVWVGITIGVFVAGFFIGGSIFGIFSSSIEHASPPPVVTMMPNPQMMNDPDLMNQWHQQMMKDPQTMNQWMNTMMNDPDFMNQWHQQMLNDPQSMQHLKTFDELDFDVFTNQKWDRLKESHSNDIIVHWPDGTQTSGIERHLEDLKAMFVYAPDTRIQEHPVKIASGQWTSVIGVMEGTFTEPMPLPDGTTIPPTGKSFELKMVTVGHWKNGVMDEEYLFWDNLAFMKQIGLAE